jgi:hypothetical protein
VRSGWFLPLVYVEGNVEAFANGSNEGCGRKTSMFSTSPMGNQKVLIPAKLSYKCMAPIKVPLDFFKEGKADFKILSP